MYEHGIMPGLGMGQQAGIDWSGQLSWMMRSLRVYPSGPGISCTYTPAGTYVSVKPGSPPPDPRRTPRPWDLEIEGHVARFKQRYLSIGGTPSDEVECEDCDLSGAEDGAVLAILVSLRGIAETYDYPPDTPSPGGGPQTGGAAAPGGLEAVEPALYADMAAARADSTGSEERMGRVVRPLYILHYTPPPEGADEGAEGSWSVRVDLRNMPEIAAYA